MLTQAEADRQVEAAFARHKRGELKFAGDVYRSVLAVYRDHPAALHYLGLIAQQTGHSREAVGLIQRSIDLDPKDARAHNHLGQVHVALGDRRTATACFERALELDPDHVDSLNNLANVIKVRDLNRAIALYRRALELKPTAAFAAYNLAAALDEDAKHAESMTYLERTIEMDPKHAPARHRLAVLLEQMGRFDEAGAHYREVRRLDPRHTSSLANLIAMRSSRPDEQMAGDALRLLDSPDVSEDDRLKLNHGLGKYLDSTGEHARAFEHFAACKAIVRKRAPPFEVAAHAANFDRLIKVFSREFLAGRDHGADSSHRPVFIVGMPRSGTTLAEQILASHPLVFGAGELTEMPRIVKSLRPYYPESVATLPAPEVAQLAAQYLAVIDARSPSDAQRVTDKMPMNFQHLGLIATLFPNAHIVHCRRDPRDVGISCFIELFELEHGYTSDLAAFAGFFLEYERLMAHWRAALPMPIFELRYEQMVAEPEATSRALVAHCGLEWDAACLSFEKSERTVQTPSRWQVRQPIYRTSLGRWRNYESQLAPLIGVLEASGYTYG